MLDIMEVCLPVGFPHPSQLGVWGEGILVLDQIVCSDPVLSGISYVWVSAAVHPQRLSQLWGYRLAGDN